jgi:hypothetical protein
MTINYQVIVELFIFFVFVYAIAAEFNAISNNTTACQRAQSIAANASPCDMIGSAAQLNANSERELSVGWRRAVIASATLCSVSQFALNIPLSVQQKLGLFVLTFFTVLSVEGFSNYYFSNATSLAVDTNLQSAMRTFDSNTCSSGLHYQSLAKWLRPLQLP